MIPLPDRRTYAWFVTAMVLVELFSWVAYQRSWLEQLVTALVVLAAGVLAWKRPSWLSYGTVAELMIGGKGYLLFFTIHGEKISIRLLLFLVLFLSSMPRLVRVWSSLRRTVLRPAYLFLLAWLLVSAGIGLLRGHGWSGVFFDANAFLFLGLLPIWWIWLQTDPLWRTNLLAVLFAAATVIGLESWLMVLLFGQNLSGIHSVYLWIRNTGVGEVTLINGNVFRVFFQSQIYSLLTFCVLLVMWVQHSMPRWWWMPWLFSVLGLYVSLSRSFWLGAGVFAVGLCVWLLRTHRYKKMWRVWVVLPAAVFAWAMMIWAISWPTFSLHGPTNVVAERLNGGSSADAATARQNQLQPLLQAIRLHPVIGSGFGQTVTYFSTDPTVHGWRTTSAFELGYFDLWLKIGLFGLGLYAWWILSIWRSAARTIWGPGLILAGIALVTVHLTTPYLNHPLGLGWLMLTALYAYAPA